MSDSPKNPGPAGAVAVEITPEMIEAGTEAYYQWAEKNLIGDAAEALHEPKHIVRNLVVEVFRSMHR